MSESQLSTTSAEASLPDFGAKILALAHELAQWTELPEGLMCTYFSPAHKAAAAQLRDWMANAGMDAAIDPVGNVIGRYRSDAPDAKKRQRAFRGGSRCYPVYAAVLQ